MKRLRKRIALILAFLLVFFLALGPLWPLTSALSERVWWIILVLVGLALAWPRGVFGESPAPQVNPPKNLAKKERILAYLRAAKNSQFAQEGLSEMLLEMAVGILAFKRGVEEEEAWREIRSGKWPNDENFWHVLRTDKQRENFPRLFSSALEALERELG
jgi:hypothetical protein